MKRRVKYMNNNYPEFVQELTKPTYHLNQFVTTHGLDVEYNQRYIGDILYSDDKPTKKWEKHLYYNINRRINNVNKLIYSLFVGNEYDQYITIHHLSQDISVLSKYIKFINRDSVKDKVKRVISIAIRLLKIISEG